MDKIDEIRNLNNKISLLKDEVSNEYNEINYPIWPVIADLKKKKKRYLWLVTIFGCALFSVLVWIFFFEIVNEYWIGGSIGFVSLWLILFIILYIIYYKKYQKLDKEWKKALESPDKKNQELNELINKAINEMKTYIGDDEELKNIGDSYNDIYEYYNSYIERNNK